jgi:hypothetical protein
MISNRDILAGYKRPPVVAASIKLTNKEKDWNLPGFHCSPPKTRTRNGGNGRPQYSTRKKRFNEPESEEDDLEEEKEENAQEKKNLKMMLMRTSQYLKRTMKNFPTK